MVELKLKQIQSLNGDVQGKGHENNVISISGTGGIINAEGNRITNLSGLVLNNSTTAPGGAPASNTGIFWVKNDNPTTPIFTDSDGVDHNILTSSGAVSSVTSSSNVITISPTTGNVVVSTPNLKINSGSIFIGPNTPNSGSSNVIMGNASGQNSTGNNNTYLGAFSGQDATTATNNVLIGYRAGASITSGSNNVLIGPAVAADGSGNITDSSNAIVIGNNIGVPTTSKDGFINIGGMFLGYTNTTEAKTALGVPSTNLNNIINQEARNSAYSSDLSEAPFSLQNTNDSTEVKLWVSSGSAPKFSDITADPGDIYIFKNDLGKNSKIYQHRGSSSSNNESDYFDLSAYSTISIDGYENKLPQQQVLNFVSGNGIKVTATDNYDDNNTQISISSNIVKNYTELKNAKFYDEAFITVLGCNEENDGGHGVFIYDTNSLENDNNGTVIRPNSISPESPGRWIRVINDNTLNIKWFGAIGDGATNNVNAFNRAMSVLSSNGGTLFIPIGTYLLSSQISIPNSNITITGEDRDLSILKGPENSTSGFVLNGNITINNIRFSGWRHVLLYNDPNGIENVYIKNCNFINNTARAITPNTHTTPIYNVVIDGCRIYNHIGNTQGGGFILLSSVVDNITITNNIIENILNTAGGASAITVGANFGDGYMMSNINVSNNIIKNITALGETHAILVYGTRVSIINNKIDTVETLGTADCEAIYTKATMGIISGNQIRNGGSPSGGAIQIKGSSRTNQDGTPAGYTMRVIGNSILDDRDDISGAGISIHRGDLDVSHNIIEGCRDAGIYLAPPHSENVSITDNELINIRWEASIELRNSMKSIHVSRNKIHSMTSGDGIRVHIATGAVTAEDIIIEDNYIYDIGSPGRGINLRPLVGEIKRIRIANNTIDVPGPLGAVQLAETHALRVKDLVCVNNQYLNVGPSSNLLLTGSSVLGKYPLIHDNTDNDKISFFGNNPIIQPTITGASNISALQSLINSLDDLGLITDATSINPFSSFSIVSTITDLRNLNINSNISQYYVLGYHTAGDGGGGIFYWDSTAGGEDNGGTVIRPASNPAFGRWKRLFSGDKLNIKWFGAVGDDVTDDTEAIKTALNAAGQNNTIYMPAGTYLVSEPIRVSARRIVGERHGRAVVNGTIVKADAEIESIFFTSSSPTTLENILLDGYGLADYCVHTYKSHSSSTIIRNVIATRSKTAGFFFEYSMGMAISSIIANGNFGDGIVIEDGNSSNISEFQSIQNQGSGLVIRGNEASGGVYVLNGDIEANSNYAIYVDSVVTTAVLENIWIEHPAIGFDTIVIDNSRHINIRNCRLSGYGIEDTRAIRLINNSRNCLIEGNSVAPGDGYELYASIELEPGSQNNRIFGNYRLSGIVTRELQTNHTDRNWVDQRTVGYMNSVPSSGVWRDGDIIWNITPSTTEPMGWMCVSGGSPGVWKSMPHLLSDNYISPQLADNVETTDDTETVIMEFSIPNNNSGLISFDIVGRLDSGELWSNTIKAYVENDNGTLTITNTDVGTPWDPDTLGYSASLDVSGTLVQVKVIGDIDGNVKWACSSRGLTVGL